jgi:hypothetical protein
MAALTSALDLVGAVTPTVASVEIGGSGSSMVREGPSPEGPCLGGHLYSPKSPRCTSIGSWKGCVASCYLSQKFCLQNYGVGWWRNGSAFDSRSKGCEFDSRPPQNLLQSFAIHLNLYVIEAVTVAQLKWLRAAVQTGAPRARVRFRPRPERRGVHAHIIATAQPRHVPSVVDIFNN